MALARPESTTARELRAAWTAGRVVVLSLSERCEPRRLEGRVQHVAVTDAFVIVAGWHVPMCDVIGTHRPHFEQVAKSDRAA